MTCCLGDLNTIIRAGMNWPVVYGVGVNTETGELFPATFPDKGPELGLRSARFYTGGHQVSSTNYGGGAAPTASATTPAATS